MSGHNSLREGKRASTTDQEAAARERSPVQATLRQGDIWSWTRVWTDGPFEGEGQQSDAFGHAFYAPLIERERRKVIAAGVSTALAEEFAHTLDAELCTACERVLANEFNAHAADFAGSATPLVAFEQFLAASRMSVAQRSPVLTRRLMTIAAGRGDALVEAVLRVQSEANVLRHRHGIWGDLISVQPVGDPHHGQRSAMRLGFANGRKLVYKPRPLASDLLVGQLFTLLNEWGFSQPLLHPEATTFGSWGVVEFIEERAPGSVHESRRLLHRLGGALAVLYLVGATDQHRENILVHGDTPYFIDLETILRPRLTTDSDEAIASESVLMVGMLPNHTLGREGSPGLDLSILGGLEVQHSTRLIPRLQVRDAQASFQPTPVPIPANPVAAALRSVPVREQSELLQAGFAEACALMTERRPEVADAIRRFDGRTRVLLRNTDTYGQLLEQAAHPKLARDADTTEQFFGRLWAYPNIHMPELRTAVPHEIEALWHGDVPLFTVDTTGWVYGQERDKPIMRFDQPGHNLMFQRLERLGPDEVRRQQFVIASTMALAEGRVGSAHAPPQPQGPDAPADDRLLLDAAVRIGDDLARLAFRDNGRAGWLGPMLAYRRGWFTGPLRLDLYSGLPGVIVFLASLADVTHNSRYRTLAEEGLVTLREMVRRSRQTYTFVGAFQGWGGLLYTLYVLARLWRRNDLLEEAEALLPELASRLTSDEYLDVVGGCAGSVLACLAGASLGSDQARVVAGRAGDELLRQAHTLTCGTGWLSKGAPGPLTGFAHGAAGVALALERLTSATGDERYLVAARGGLQFERSVFDEATQTWPDLRKDTGGGDAPQSVTVHAWCYGSVGIGLARVRSPWVDESKRSEIAVAVRAALTQPYGTDYTPCHGDAARLELLCEVAEPEAHRHARRIAGAITAGIQGGDYRCGLPFPGVSPGLMVGLSGIGLSLLRVAHGPRVPSPLTLELPSPLGGG